MCFYWQRHHLLTSSSLALTVKTNSRRLVREEKRIGVLEGVDLEIILEFGLSFQSKMKRNKSNMINLERYFKRKHCFLQIIEYSKKIHEKKS